MGAIVGLDKSGWPAAALARDAQAAAELARFKRRKAWESSEDGQRYLKALAEHPLASVVDGLDDESLDASRQPRWRLKHRDFGNGHVEVVVTKETPDPRRTLELAIKRDCQALAYTDPEDRTNNVERAVRRAKQQVRLKCKAINANSLWTLTFQENLTDRDEALRCFDLFRRKVAKYFGGWVYVSVMERQERGAYHFHIAAHKLPARLKWVDPTSGRAVLLKSWDVMRRLWRQSTGAYGGNFDEAMRQKRWPSGRVQKVPVRGTAAIAAYIAGYVAKDMAESPENRKRFSSSRQVVVPEAYMALFPGETPLSELIELAYAAIGERVSQCWLAVQRGVFFIASDDTRPFPGGSAP